MDSPEENETQLLDIPMLMNTDVSIEQDFSRDDQIRVKASADLSNEPVDSDDAELLEPAPEPHSDESSNPEDSDKLSVELESSFEYHATHEAKYEQPLSEEEQFHASLAQLNLSESDPDKPDKAVDNAFEQTSSGCWLRQAAWLLGSLAMLIIVIVVIFWFKRFELAADPAWRPVIDKICSYVECGIPPQRDISRIELRSREVTVTETTVKVNMILINRASFNQPYPRIEIDFFDLDGNRLATRVKLPVEYLRQDIRKSIMPAGIPVHIEFDVEVETEDVVGYEFRFL